jgi:hypothetical protein
MIAAGKYNLDSFGKRTPAAGFILYGIFFLLISCDFSGGSVVPMEYHLSNTLETSPSCRAEPIHASAGAWEWVYAECAHTRVRHGHTLAASSVREETRRDGGTVPACAVAPLGAARPGLVLPDVASSAAGISASRRRVPGR